MFGWSVSGVQIPAREVFGSLGIFIYIIYIHIYYDILYIYEDFRMSCIIPVISNVKPPGFPWLSVNFFFSLGGWAWWCGWKWDRYRKGCNQTTNLPLVELFVWGGSMFLLRIFFRRSKMLICLFGWSVYRGKQRRTVKRHVRRLVAFLELWRLWKRTRRICQRLRRRRPDFFRQKDGRYTPEN